MWQTVQLNLLGRPSAFDLSPSKLEVCVASPGSLSFFELNGTGTGAPKQLLHYEQPQQVRKVVFREFGQVAVLRGGAVSFFDANNILRPLKSSLKPGSWANDIDWAANSPTVIAIACDSGHVKLFDTRAAGSPIGTMTASTSSESAPKNCVRWSPGEDASYLTASSAKAVHIWDTRKNALLSEIHSLSSEGVSHFLWDTNGSNQTACADVGLAVFNKGASSTLQWVAAPNFTTDDAQSSTFASSPIDIDDKSLILSVGRHAFVCCNPSGTGCSIHLVGSPNPKKGADAISCPGLELATCKDSIVGLHTGNPVRLLGSSSGAEILALTVTSSLHAIRIPNATFNEYCKVDRPQRARPQTATSISLHSLANMSGPQFSTRLLHVTTGETDTHPLRPLHSEGSFKSLSSASALSADRGREFWNNLQTDVLVLESLLQESATGVVVESVDKYARQLTFVTRRAAASDSDAVHPHEGRRGSSIGDIDFSLIVSLPARYPTIGVPSFTIRQASIAFDSKVNLLVPLRSSDFSVYVMYVTFPFI